MYDGCRMSTQVIDALAHPSREEIELGAVLHALSDSVRLNMVKALGRPS